MLGRLIQNNPFVLNQVDKLFYGHKKQIDINEKVILEYFNYIKPKINNDSIFRLLSPLLQIKNHEIEKLEALFLNFVNQKGESIFN